jgi:Mn2+/Fe2+ NRAMP family transporter
MAKIPPRWRMLTYLLIVIAIAAVFLLGLAGLQTASRLVWISAAIVLAIIGVFVTFLLLRQES